LKVKVSPKKVSCSRSERSLKSEILMLRLAARMGSARTTSVMSTSTVAVKVTGGSANAWALGSVLLLLGSVLLGPLGSVLLGPPRPLGSLAVAL
jgi:hypothetical protein